MIDLRVDGAVATITLCNPARRNAMTRSMWRDLRSVAESLNRYEHSRDLTTAHGDLQPIRCAIVQGQAGHFCAGGDISEYPDFRFDAASLQSFHEGDVAPALHALLACDMPVIAQIDGHCMGGGLEIAACCDIRIAGQEAMFGAPIAKLGMPMAPKELAIVLRAAGEATVREMLLEARSLSAQQMLQRGFVQRVVADSAVAQEAQATAQRICTLSPQAARLNKQALRQFYIQNMAAGHMDIAQAATDNVATIAPQTVHDAGQTDAYAYANSPEHVEGISAFLAKRAPQF